VGNDLRICVGGYATGAVSKVFNIMVGYKDGAPIVCMEIRDGGLSQAKMMGNNRAGNNYDVYSAVKSFCRANNIGFDECYDMVKPTSEQSQMVHIHDAMVQNYIPGPRDNLAHPF